MAKVKSIHKYVIQRDMKFKLTYRRWFKNWLRLKFKRWTAPRPYFIVINGKEFGYNPTLEQSTPFSKIEAQQFIDAVKIKDLRIRKAVKMYGKYHLV